MWDADKPSGCERCGRSFGEKQAVQTRASGVHRRATADIVIPEDTHSSLLAILQAAGGQLGLDLQSMLGPLLLNKATLEQRGTKSFRAVKGRRIAASKAKASKARSNKLVAKIEAELQKALDDQEAAIQACAKADEKMEAALAEYQADQADETALQPMQGGGGSQGPGGEDEHHYAGRAAATRLQAEETVQGLGCKRGVLQELRGAEEANGRGTPERKEQPRRFLDQEAEAARILEDAKAKAEIAKTAGAMAKGAQAPQKGPCH